MQSPAQSDSHRAGRISLDAQAAWEQLARRDPQAAFFYGVATTGVFCRAGCSSRLPRRENVRFFATVQEAQAAGFRPCKRCHPDTAQNGPMDRVRTYIEANLDRAVPLEELGRIAGMSPFTVQRRFKQAMGATPLAYQRALRTAALRQQLKEGASVTDAIYNAGFGSSSRAYEDAALGMTPARFAQGGRGERIAWSAALSPFGWIVAGTTPRGLCWLSLAASTEEGEASLRAEFPAAEIVSDPSLAHWVDAAMAMIQGESSPKSNGTECLDLRGTAFQLRVWDALRKIPRGQTLSYSALAKELGDPQATRAVARACATNRVALLVPCHRIVGADGSLTGYRWGVERKRMLLAAEGNQPQHPPVK
jgi:AraC family transcriptional regulator of adaptative response/methylated-DNA-[protein]-cysteine methyltransferase